MSFWDEMPGVETYTSVAMAVYGYPSTWEYYPVKEMDLFHEKLKGKITQLNECLGEYETQEWCEHCIIDAKCAQITLHVKDLEKKIEDMKGSKN